MEKEIENILFINTGGGIGDALISLPILNYINENFFPKKIYYYGNDFGNFWYEDKLKEYKPDNFITIKNFPLHFGFRNKHIKISKNLIKNFNFNYFDLIIDNQSRLKNTLIYKRIPHRYFISPSMNYLFSKPFIFKKKDKNLISRLIGYLDKILKKKSKPNYNITIPNSFVEKARELMPPKNKYIGFSITAGHPTRIKEISINEIIKISNFYSKDFIPTFFIEDKYLDIKNILKKEIANSYFPEENLSKNFKKPILVTALGNFTHFNLTIDNGISHMLAFSGSKTYKFCDGSGYKFKPLNNKTVIYECDENKKKINELKSEEIINFIKKN